MSTNAYAGLMVNQDFSVCDSTQWQLDTDGFGAPADTSDFSFDSSAGNCSAKIGMDNLYLDWGFANTLYTSLDLSPLGSGESATLSFDWGFTGQDLQDEWSDYFTVSLTNGSLESLIINDDYGSGSFSTVLDSSYDGWTIDFSLSGGFNFDSYTSNLTIENLSLVSQEVPEPSVLALLLAGGLLMFRRKHIAK